jgi:hypothetical protein
MKQNFCLGADDAILDFGFWILDWETGVASGFRKAIGHI